jgi:hypothetical protein
MMNIEQFQEIGSGSYSVTIKIDLSDVNERAYVQMYDSTSDAYIIDLVICSAVQLPNATDEYFITNNFLYENSFSSEPSYYFDPVAQKNNPNIYVPKTNTWVAVGVQDPQAATPIALFGDVSVSDFINPNSDFYNMKRNWGRDTVVYVKTQV